MKQYAKQLLQLLAIVAMSPLILMFYLAKGARQQENCFVFCSQLLSLIPGKTGSYLRIAFYRFSMTHCDSDVFIGFGTIFAQCDTEIHRGTYIGPQCNIGMSCIGQDVLLGSGVHILSGKNQHNFQDMETPIRDQGGEFEKIAIKNNVWIGNGSIVMADIETHSIIGSGSVVINPIPSTTIAAGNPAKVIKQR